jgi:hypothetical protein
VARRECGARLGPSGRWCVCGHVIYMTLGLLVS